MQQLASSPSQQPIAHHHGLVSVWDMYEFNAHRFLTAFDTLRRVRSIIDGHKETASTPIPENRRSQITPTLQLLRDTFQGFGANVSIGFVDDLIKRLEDKETTHSKLADGFGMIDKVWKKELLSIKMFALNPSLVSYFEKPNDKFSPDVIDVFPEASSDVEEAGRCFALGRHTACVFHLMRVVEVPLRRIAKLILPDDQKPNWDPVLKKIEAELKLPPKERTLQGSQQFYGELVAQMHAVKVAWRNKVMHVDTVMTEERAKTIYDASIGLMNYVAGHIVRNPNDFGIISSSSDASNEEPTS